MRVVMDGVEDLLFRVQARDGDVFSAEVCWAALESVSRFHDCTAGVK